MAITKERKAELVKQFGIKKKLELVKVIKLL